jgi:hypothetical protein
MPIDKLTPAQESKLVDSVMAAIHMTNDGMNPNDAIVKVATDAGFNTRFVQRMIEAFNVSKNMKHLKAASGDARAASFPIADPEIILKKLYPDVISTPAETKQSSWEPEGTIMSDERVFDLEHAPTASGAGKETTTIPDVNMLVTGAYKQLSRLRKDAEVSKDRASAARLGLSEAIEKLADYFKLSSREPFEKLEAAALEVYGNDSKPVLDFVWELARCDARRSAGEKRASGPSKVIAGDRTPYKLLAVVMAKRAEYSDLAVKYAHAASTEKGYRKALEQRLSNFKCAAGPLGMLGPAVIGGMVTKYMDPDVEGKPLDLESAEDLMFTPEYEAERKAIKSQVMLHDFMTNDAVISKAKPARVVRAFNDIASVAPRAVEAPMIMRGLVRRVIEGDVMDPYELANLAQMELSLRKQDITPMPGTSEAKGRGAGARE